MHFLESLCKASPDDTSLPAQGAEPVCDMWGDRALEQRSASRQGKIHPLTAMSVGTAAELCQWVSWWLCSGEGLFSAVCPLGGLPFWPQQRAKGENKSENE